MPYKLTQSQTGGGSFEILILIGVVVAVYFLFVQSNRPKKEKFDLLTESFAESVASDILNSNTRPALDLKTKGVPYDPIPKKFNVGSSEIVGAPLPGGLRKSMPAMVMKERKSKKTKSSTPKSETPKSESPKLVTPKTDTPKSNTPKSETPKSSTPKSETPKGVSPKVALAKVEKFTDVNNLYSVESGYELKTPLSKSTCSQKCCGYYWKENMDTLFDPKDPIKWSDVGVGKKYRTSNVTCMGDGVTPKGCRCFTADQQKILATRGGNGSGKY